MLRAPFRIFLLAALLVAAGAQGASLDVTRQAGGEPGPVLAVGAYLYQASGPGIITTNLDASAPETQSITPPAPGRVVGLALAGGFLYAAVRSDYPKGYVAVYSLTDPAAPALVLIESYSNQELNSPLAMVANGSRLYLADTEIGIVVADLTDPDDPSYSVGSAGFTSAANLKIDSGRLIGWGQNFLGDMVVEVYDLTTPATPASLGSFSVQFTFGGTVDGNFFYAFGFTLDIIDFSNLASPQTVFSGDASARDALVHNGRLYFGNETGLHVWDVSTPASATELTVVAASTTRASRSALVTVGGNPKGVFFTQESRGLRFALAGASTTLEHTWDLPGGVDVTAISGSGGLVHLGDFYSGMKSLDPATLEVEGRLDVPFGAQTAVEGLKVVGNRAYLANWSVGLQISDLTDPENPVLLGEEEIAFATAVDVVGTRAYVATSTNGGTIVTVDVSNPANPAILDTDLTSKAMDVIHHNGLLLVADESFGDPGGLRLFSLANPNAPVQVGHYSTCDSAGGVAAAGNRAYLACHDGSLHIVDITTPSSPTQLGTYLAPDVLGSALDVTLSADRAFLVRGFTVDAVTISNPASPALVARAELGVSGRRVELASGGQVWVAAGQGGVFQLDQGLFADGFESGDFAAWFAHSP